MIASLMQAEPVPEYAGMVPDEADGPAVSGKPAATDGDDGEGGALNDQDLTQARTVPQDDPQGRAG